MKEFFELVAKDKAVQAELEKASLDALKAFIESKGLTGEAQKVLRDAMTNVAKAHGFKVEKEEVSSRRDEGSGRRLLLSSSWR